MTPESLVIRQRRSCKNGQEKSLDIFDPVRVKGFLLTGAQGK
jgi:hypothetical protein